MNDTPTQRRAPGDGFSWPHAVPGLLSWAAVAACVLGVVFFPHQFRTIVTVFVGYAVVRFGVIVTFALIAELKCRAWARRDWSVAEGEPGPFGLAPADVRHVVFVPNYCEPDDVLVRTLDALAAQHRAAERLIVVLAMEEREPGARAKGADLAARYAGSFLETVVSMHPANLPGELACKAANMTHATGEVREVLAKLGIAEELVTVTSCDADSVIHPGYFAAVSQLFAADEHRHGRFWQAPMHYYNNLWNVPAPTRYSTWFIHQGHMAELAWPFYASLPISTYTLSWKLADETGWWDPLVISEDWHVYLNCLFKRGWNVRETPVWLPTLSDATDGPDLFGALKNRYDQVLRHAWGAEDVGFMITEMLRARRMPHIRTLARFAQVTHDHVMRVQMWAMMMSAYVLQLGPRHAYAGSQVLDAPVYHGPDPIRYLFAVGGVFILSVIVIELLRHPPRPRRPVALMALEIAAMWFLAPVFGFIFGTLPALHAQTKLLAGLPLTWKVTPKKLVERLGEV